MDQRKSQCYVKILIDTNTALLTLIPVIYFLKDKVLVSVLIRFPFYIFLISFPSQAESDELSSPKNMLGLSLKLKLLKYFQCQVYVYAFSPQKSMRARITVCLSLCSQLCIILDTL